MSRLARREPPLEWVKPGFRAASIALSAGLVVVWARGDRRLRRTQPLGLPCLLRAGLSGAALIARLGFEALTLVAVVRGWRTPPALPRRVAGACSPPPGHAAGVQPAWLGIGLDAVHLLAAGLWAGGIARAGRAAASRGLAIDRGAPRCSARFTPVALAAFGGTVVAGGLEAIEQLGSFQSLFGTDYGRVLLAKMALVACMLPLSLMAWRLERPHVRVEASIAACVVGAAALLASFPAPPTTAEQQAAEAAALAPTAGLPAAGRAHHGRSRGQRAGRSEPLTGDARARTAQPCTCSRSPGAPPRRAIARQHLGERRLQGAAACGDTCRQATIDIKAGRHGRGRRAEPGGRRGRRSRSRRFRRRPATTLLAQLETAMHKPDRLSVQRGAELGHRPRQRRTTRRSRLTGRRGRWPARSQTIIRSARPSTRATRPGEPWHTEPGLVAATRAVIRLGFLRAADQRARDRPGRCSTACRRRGRQLRQQGRRRRSGSPSGSTTQRAGPPGRRWTRPVTS